MKETTTKKKAYVIVGHSNWGKTSTLQSLCGITSRPGPYPPLVLNNAKIPVKSSSNDDTGDGLYAWIERKAQKKVERFIFPFCPDFSNPDKRTDDIINFVLKEGYELYFWVIEKQQMPNTNRVIAIAEINTLRRHGFVEVSSTIALNQQNVLATEFESFIIKHF